MKWIVCVTVMGWLLFSYMTTEKSEDWPMFMHDPQHSGYSTSSMPLSLRKVWEYSMDSDLTSTSVSVRFIVSEGRLITVQNGSSLFSLDVRDGSLQWKTSVETTGLSLPAAADDRVYIGIDEGILCCDAHTGDILWKYEDTNVFFRSPPLVVDDHVVMGSWSGHLDFWGPDSADQTRDMIQKKKRVLCLNAETGEIEWEFYAHGFTGDASPAYFDGKIYMNYGDGKIYCLNAETGEYIWEHDMEAFSDSSLSLDGERIFIGTGKGILYCHNRKKGDILWRFDSKDSIYATPALGYDKVFFGSQNGIFYCLNAQNGELIWALETEIKPRTPVARIFSAVIVADRKVAFGATDGTLLIVDALSGEIINSYYLEGNGIVSLALSEGALFVGEGNGRITCFDEAPAQPGSPPPTTAPGPSTPSIPLFAVIVLVVALIGIPIVYYLMKHKKSRND